MAYCAAKKNVLPTRVLEVCLTSQNAVKAFVEQALSVVRNRDGTTTYRVYITDLDQYSPVVVMHEVLFDAEAAHDATVLSRPPDMRAISQELQERQRAKDLDRIEARRDHYKDNPPALAMRQPHYVRNKALSIITEGAEAVGGAEAKLNDGHDAAGFEDLAIVATLDTIPAEHLAAMGAEEQSAPNGEISDR